MLKKTAGIIKRYSTAICGAAAVAVIAVIAVNASGEVMQTSSTEITNWGLSFQTEGEKPVGNASSEELASYNSLYCTEDTDKTIYLTFDAGFENGNMPQILEALEKHNVKATFFLVGHYFETQPELVKQMVAEGHTVGNHTYSHPDMAAIVGENEFRTELEKNEALYKEITGSDMPRLYRPPQGKFSESNLNLANQMGYQTVFWSLAYVDWQQDRQPSADEAFSKLLPRVHPGAVVLLHSTSSTNGEIMDELLTKWEEMGYSFGDLEGYLSTHKN